MRCAVCKHGELKEGTTTLTLERGSTTLVFKGVPARICKNCNEDYVDEATTAALLKTAEEVARAGVRSRGGDER